jgi:transposase
VAAKTKRWDATKNHGRLSSAAYSGCPVIQVPFEDEGLKQGICPRCKTCHTQGKLLYEKPMVIVLLESQPLVAGYRYALARVRCNICEAYYTAALPEEVRGRKKYDASCKTTIAIHHYYGGLPFKRLEMLQAAQGVPLPDATQFDLMHQLYQEAMLPVFKALVYCAAQSDEFFFDDTPGRIVDVIAYNNRLEDKSQKISIHSTALVNRYQGHRIYLYYTNPLAAGKQFSELIAKREVDTHFLTMSDASPSNFSEVSEHLYVRWILTLCLTHGRRKFFDLLGIYDEECDFVLEQLGKVYSNDAYCKQKSYSQKERLAHHQAHSAPVMAALRVWLNNLLLYRAVEPNSELGKAIIYMLKRWYWLTQFLRVPGASLDNSIAERTIKLLIRYRKNSLFYKNTYGAEVGDALMSVIYTAADGKVSIFDYINTLQAHAADVQASPEDWLPWQYQTTLAQLKMGLTG